MIQTLRRTLNSRGFQQVGIIAADLLPSDAWTIADDILRDPELFNAVDVIGLVLTHYNILLLLLPPPLLPPVLLQLRSYTMTATNHDGHKVYHDGHSNENMKN